MPHYLFSYGSLQDEAVQLRIFKRKLIGIAAILYGYHLVENEYLGKFPVIYASTNSQNTVKGMVYEITKTELSLCDQYETDYYKRINIVLPLHPQAWVYVRNSR
ncbi:MAG: gamma-glutamylcyclotransferase [Croceitalea sp.]|nr:gamma-glutamylcyclotransferase [Croceitalea sp.]NNC35479.1 gamma-glutamylcyclotransferase [Croceitalea sp.]NNL07753.1 gamma-glutamylcyclotransferase [Croceitalea sp.]NNM17289.1 gamma-glutamylcyclotransferase [Croceitalea sp.]